MCCTHGPIALNVVFLKCSVNIPKKKIKAIYISVSAGEMYSYLAHSRFASIIAHSFNFTFTRQCVLLRAY